MASLPNRCTVKVISQKWHKHLRKGRSSELWPDALRKCILGPSTILMHRCVPAVYGYFNPQIQIAEDYEYFLRIIAQFSVAYLDKPLVTKRDSFPATTPQLSHLPPWIEPFRTSALERLLARPGSALLQNLKTI